MAVELVPERRKLVVMLRNRSVLFLDDSDCSVCGEHSQTLDLDLYKTWNLACDLHRGCREHKTA